MAPKSKTATSNGSAAPKKSVTGPANGAALDSKIDTSDAAQLGHASKPDKQSYDAEQDRIKKEIEALQVKLSAVREKVGLATKGGAGNEKRNALRTELDGLRGQQSTNKSARGKVLDQIKDINDRIQRKIKDLQASKGKVPFKTVAEVDAHIRNLETRVESGSMKLAEEKRALQEISQCKRNRRIVETFEGEQAGIDADKQAVEELRKQLDDPLVKSVSDRYDTIKAELDQLKKEEDEAYGNRNKLFAERDALQEEINTLWAAKREASTQYREAGDRYWAKVNEDRARRAERARAQRTADEAAKKKEIAERLLEEAEVPAFQSQIEDCQTLIDYFSGKTTTAPTLKTAPAGDAREIAGVQKLEIRKVEDAMDGMVVRKKKGEDEESYFVGGKGKKAKKGPKPTAAAPSESATSSNQLNIPLATLSALLSLSIPPPGSSADLPRVVEDLNTKKAWFEANQARVTAENIAKAEAEIKRLTQAKGDDVADQSPSATLDDVTGPNGGGEKPAEPAPTPSANEALAVGVPSEAVDEKLESIQESE